MIQCVTLGEVTASKMRCESVFTTALEMYSKVEQHFAVFFN